MAGIVIVLLFSYVALFTITAAQIDPGLIGTWTTKSRKVLTGPVRTLPGDLIFVENTEYFSNNWRW